MIAEIENTVPIHVKVPLIRDATKYHPVPLLVVDSRNGYHCVSMPLPSDPSKRILNWVKIEDCKDV